MVKDTIDRDPKYVFHHPNVKSILLLLFQSQDGPKIQKKYIQKSKNPRYDPGGALGTPKVPPAAARTMQATHCSIHTSAAPDGWLRIRRVVKDPTDGCSPWQPLLENPVAGVEKEQSITGS